MDRLRALLLDWYDRNKRALPWRDSNDPYRIWLAEAMLQQTQTATVLPYYERFVQRFPTIQTLADADQSEVEKAWEGLGYYSRVRNLRKAARMVMEEFGGELPKEAAELQGLPGIGRYTAGAVASIAFGRREPVVDGNVERVLCRAFALDMPAGSARNRRLWEIAAEMVDPERPGDFNQALMELGATVCTKHNPACDECPWRGECKAFADGAVGGLPRPKERPAGVRLTVACAIVRRGDEFAIARRVEGGLWGGLWEFPQASVIEGEDIESAARRAALAIGLTAGRMTAVGRFRAQATHRRIELCAFFGLMESGEMEVGDGLAPERGTDAVLPGPYSDARWASLDELSLLAMSAPMRRVVKAISGG